MKRLFFILGGLMLLALTACVNEKISIEDQFAGEKITVKAYMPEGNTPSTRVSYNDDNNPETNDPFVLSWSAGDDFSVIRGGQNKIFSNEGTNDLNDFSGVLPTEGSGDYYAVYPEIDNEEQAVNPAAVPFDISSQVNGLPFLMYASSVDGNSFQFKHALAYLKLKVNIPESLQGNPDLLCIWFPKFLSSKGNLNLSSGQTELTTADSDYSELVYKVVNYQGSSMEFMFAIPPIPSSTSCMLKITNESGIYAAYLEKEAGKAIKAGEYYTAEITLYEFS